MQRELLDPFVPVTLVELGAVCRMPEEPRPLTDLWTQGLVESPESPGAELLPGSRVPVVTRNLVQ